jgi:hypothetical protein
MTNANEANALVNEYEAKVLAWKKDEAQQLVQRADTNIIERATRGKKSANVGLSGFVDKGIIQMATDEILAAGYRVTLQGNNLLIEW